MSELKVKITTIILFICLTAPVVITFPILKYQKKLIKREIKWKIIAGMDKSELVLLKFSKRDLNDLNWKHSKEFEYKSQMYDIVEFQKKNDTSYYWCWWDHAETALNKKLNSIVIGALGHNQDNKENLFYLDAFYKNLFCESNFNLYRNKQVFVDSKINYFYDENKYCSFIFPPIPPPPKQFYI
jgi:hypothetical protein